MWLPALQNILAQNTRMQALVETLLRQARLEKPAGYPPRRLLMSLHLRSLARRAGIFVLAAKISPLYSTAFLAGCRRRRGASMRGAGQCVDNAIDFTPENGVITLSAQPMGGRKRDPAGDRIPAVAPDRAAAHFRPILFVALRKRT